MKKIEIIIYFLFLVLITMNSYSRCIESYEKKILHTHNKLQNNYVVMKDLLKNVSDSRFNSSYEKLRLDLRKKDIMLPNQALYAPTHAIRFLISKYIEKFDQFDYFCENEESPLSYTEFISQFKNLLKKYKNQTYLPPLIVTIPASCYQLDKNSFLESDELMTPLEKKSIRGYMAYGDFKPINNGLRAKKIEEKYLSHIVAMISGLKKLPISSKNYPLFRVSHLFPGGIESDDLKINQIVTSKGFLSTSISKEIFFSGKYQMKIINNKSGRILNSLINEDMINRLQAVEKEDEVLFFPGSKFKYLGQEKKTSKLESDVYYVFEELYFEGNP